MKRNILLSMILAALLAASLLAFFLFDVIEERPAVPLEFVDPLP